MSSICLPPVLPKPNQDSLDLHRAFQGLGCNGQAVIRILAHRDTFHRSQIQTVYKNMFQEELCKRIKRELHRHFQKAMLMWMQDAPERDAFVLKGALHHCNAPQRRNQILAEVLSTKTLDELDSIARAYDSLYGRPLQKDIELMVSGSCRTLFILCLHGNRDDTMDLDSYHALEQAKKLHSALSTNIEETTLISVLTTRSQRQLRAIFDVYKTTFGHDIYKEFVKKDDAATEFQKTVRIITKCVSNPGNYFAKVLYKSMKGLGTDDDTLIRVIITRAEVDMIDIKMAFFQKYQKALSSMVSSDTTGNYKRFLLALIGAPY